MKLSNFCHNQIDEFIGLCKKSNIIQSFINDPLGKDISKNISISLYDSGYGFGGAKIERVSLNDFITLAMNKDISNQNELISHIEQQNTQNFWENFEKDLLSVNKDIQNYEKNKSVLIPEAKERIPKEILAKINTLDKDFQRESAYKTYQIKNTQALENISKFYQMHAHQSRANTR